MRQAFPDWTWFISFLLFPFLYLFFSQPNLIRFGPDQIFLSNSEFSTKKMAGSSGALIGYFGTANRPEAKFDFSRVGFQKVYFFLIKIENQFIVITIAELCFRLERTIFWIEKNVGRKLVPTWIRPRSFFSINKRIWVFGGPRNRISEKFVPDFNNKQNKFKFFTLQKVQP